MSYQRNFAKIKEQLGASAVDQLTEVFEKESREADEPWKKTMLSLLAESAQRHGPEGFDIAQRAVERFLSSGDIQDIRKVSKNLMTASNLLAQIQNQEADDKEKIRAWLRGMLGVVGKILKVVVSAAL